MTNKHSMLSTATPTERTESQLESALEALAAAMALHRKGRYGDLGAELVDAAERVVSVLETRLHLLTFMSPEEADKQVAAGYRIA